MVAEKSFQVDQSGLTGSVSDDMAAMFGKGDNVAQHLSSLFGGSYTLSVSANEEVSCPALFLWLTKYCCSGSGTGFQWPCVLPQC